MYRSIDLFAGIGGMRLGIEKTGKVKTVYSNEIDKNACKTYSVNFGDNPQGDITKVDPKELPDFDLLMGGFPCQAFSIAGRKLGFEDARGTLFFDVARLIKEKRPAAFILENVRNLETHDKGQTFNVMKDILTKELRYKVVHKVLNAKNFGLAQNRPRIFIVGFRSDIDSFGYMIPEKLNKTMTIGDIMEQNVPLEYFIRKKRFEGMERHRNRHLSKGNGFGYMIHNSDDVANAIVVGGMGRERNLIIDKKSFSKHKNHPEIGTFSEKAIRYLTPRECARLQGFPEDYIIPVPKSVAYKQFGNSVPVPIVHEIGKSVLDVLDRNLKASVKVASRKKN